MHRLVSQLKAQGIVQSARVEAALLATDRALFVRDSSQAYTDCPHPIGYGATISAPHMHAYCMEWLVAAVPDARAVLDVGSGSGYLVAALAHLYPQATVQGVEIVPELVEWSARNLLAFDPALRASERVRVCTGNGWESLQGSTFDVIHVGAAASRVPEELVAALRPNGVLLLPVGPDKGDQAMQLWRKDARGELQEPRVLLGVRYVPLVQTRAK